MSISHLRPLGRRKVALLATYRRNGTAVRTPVSIVVDGDTAYIRTFGHTGKAKRIRRNNDVLVAPATFRGKPLGPEIRANAWLLNGDAARQASRRISRRSPLLEGLIVPLVARLRNYVMLHYALAPRD